MSLNKSLNRFNNTKIVLPKKQRVYHLFEQQVEQTPHAPAVIIGKQVLTYAQLNEKANAVAHFLLETAAIKAGDRVGIALDRSEWVPVAMLAVFKAGGVYVPTDLSYPIERIKQIVTDSACKVVLTEKKQSKLLKTSLANLAKKPQHIQPQIINIRDIKQTKTTNPQLSISQQSPAFIIYTSGSTGAPKGIIQTHQCLDNLIRWQLRQTGKNWKILQYASLGFDVSLQEILYALASGSVLYMIAEKRRYDMPFLAKFITEKKITLFTMVFSALNLLFKEREMQRNKHLRHIITSGEALLMTPELKRYLVANKKATLHNQYGPAETHVATAYSISGYMKMPVHPPIGKPIANTQIFILDQDHQPVPIGTQGEIYIGGACLAAGYLNKKALTAEKFVPHLTHKKANMYKTGDLGRWLPNGDIECLGRADFQVKIRGYRVELGEIETVLLSHQAIKESVVVAQENQSGDKQLVAYLVLQKTKKAHKRDDIPLVMHKFLAEKLPAYMIPAAFVVMKKLPLTHSGKIDRKNLPTPDDINQFPVFAKKNIKSDKSKKELNADSYQIDETDLQHKVHQKIWAFVGDILSLPIRIDDIDPDIDLRQHGLNSLGLVKLISAINTHYSIDIEPASFFDYPSMRLFIDALIAQYKDNFVAHYKAKETLKMIPIATDTVSNNSKNTSEKIEQTEAAVSDLSVSKEQQKQKHNKGSETEDIAIIGVAGALPQSEDLEDFWQHLKNADDLITEIPQERWDWREYFGDPTQEANKTDIKWGGFIDYMDKFDARFFKLSPREAELMDPQHRLFTEIVWQCLEDAGYKPSALAGTKTSVFVGIGSSDYNDHLYNADSAEFNGFLGTYAAALPNKISYLLDLHGESEPVNAACSSSLVAIHKAVRSIQQGDSDIAIAGGVNALLSPRSYIALSKSGALSKDGQSKVFDKNANGYVRGEGAGAVLLKSLSQAIKDKDHIWGVIKGTAVNHGGRVSSFTVPNPVAQADLLVEAYSKAQIDPTSVSYIEAHGTGTAMGDPVEVRSLQKAFTRLYKNADKKIKKQHIGLGSVKANVGHLETAAGMASLIKMLLCMKHKTLPKAIHFEQINPQVQLENSPFYVVEQTQKWRARKDNAKGNKNNKDKKIRRAGISSFGIGGVNAHLIIDEYRQTETNMPVNTAQQPQLFVLSAKTPDRLQAYASKMVQFLQKADASTVCLEDIAYTLQIAREAMPHRLAIIATTLDELITRLQSYLTGKTDSAIYNGNNKNINQFSDLIQGEEGKLFITAIINNRNIAKLARLWSAGMEVDWRLLYNNTSTPNRISLPTYPFARTRHWVATQKPTLPVQTQTQTSSKKSVNVTSDSTEQANPQNPETTTLYFKPIWQASPISTLNASTASTASIAEMLMIDTNQANDFQYNAAADYQTIVLRQPANADASAGFYALFHLVKHILSQRPKKPLNLIYTYQSKAIASDDAHPFADCFHRAISGFIRTAANENSQLSYKLIEFAENADSALIEAKLAEECHVMGHSHEMEIRYQDGQRHVKVLAEFDNKASSNTVSLKRHGTYLITGGMGGLGRIFADYLATAWNANIVLAGRAAFTLDKDNTISALNKAGGNACYIQADISDYDDVAQLTAETKNRFGTIDGIIHAAGIIKDAFIVNKSEAEIQAVLAAKVDGVLNLDRATKNEPLDFFALFSSISGLMGNLGQSDYSYANAFLDNVAQTRDVLQQQGLRHGKSLSIQWTLWQNGGMSIDQATETMLANTFGITPLDTQAGIDTFIQGLSGDQHQFAVIKGFAEKIRAIFIPENRAKAEQLEQASQPQSAAENITHEPQVDHAQLLAKVLAEVLQATAVVLKMDQATMEADMDISEYGFDSITTTELINNINQRYDLSLLPVLFFEHDTMDSIARYLCDTHQEKMLAQHSNALIPTNVEQNIEDNNQVACVEERNTGGSNIDSSLPSSHSKNNICDEPIAITGMAGMMPNSKDLAEFWQHLQDGDDLISDFPQERREWTGQSATLAGKLSAGIKQGGFIEDIDKFDPSFFKMTPHEAEFMDPQHRIMLETVWKCIEDSGCKPSDLSGTKTAVFVGIAFSDYYTMMMNSDAATHVQGFLGTMQAYIANRISYLFNLKGPSESVNTVCSSSLVAIHRAIQTIRSGEAEAAIAGGVNAILDPDIFRPLDDSGFLSPDNRCKTFAKDANGYVRSEGVGAILMKPLSKALANNDTIYAVIKGSAVNHGGHVSGMTVPNPNAQADLLVDAYTKAGIDPTTVSYIENHGTGTELGDPIEINGLKKAFQHLYQQHDKPSTATQAHCALGTVKSNIGHLESAAGIAGVLKVLLAMRHKKIPASIHVNEINPQIEIEDTPFYIARQTQDWTPLADADGNLTRRAGVSSFGAGGANAHIILEAYEQKQAPIHTPLAEPVIFVLSAKNSQRLTAYAQQMVAFLQDVDQATLSLSDMAYTSQVGREAMEQRLALIVKSVDELQTKLQRFITNANDINHSDGCYHAQIAQSKDTTSAQTIKQWFTQGEYDTLLSRWVKGLAVDWDSLYQTNTDAAHQPNRVALPTYPFAREHYWLVETGVNYILDAKTAHKKTNSHIPVSTTLTHFIHPLLHSNKSNLMRQYFTSTFTGEEFFFTDHVVNGEHILPGVAYLELARAAIAEAAGLTDEESHHSVSLQNVVWAQPIVVGATATTVTTEVIPEDDSEIAYEIQTKDGLHAQGKAIIVEVEEVLGVDITALQASCSRTMLADECYTILQHSGINYGANLRGIEKLYIGDGMVLAKLVLPTDANTKMHTAQNDFFLHPCMMDSAFQALISLKTGNLHAEDSEPDVPFLLEELDIFGQTTDSMWAHIRQIHDNNGFADTDIKKYDIDLIDEHGNIRVQLKGLCEKTLKEEKQEEKKLVQGATATNAEVSSPHSIINGIHNDDMLVSIWDPLMSVEEDHSLLQQEKLLVIGGDKTAQQAMLQRSPQAMLLPLNAEQIATSTIEKLAEQISTYDMDSIEHILWISPSGATEFLKDGKIIKEQETGVIALFKIIKAFIQSGYDSKDLAWTIITIGCQQVVKEDRANPSYSSIHGLIGSMAKEYPYWQVRVVDVPSSTDIPFEAIFRLTADEEGDALCWRNGEWYQQKLIPFNAAPYDVANDEHETLYKQGGVYVVIGGAGGLGAVWTEHMMRNYQAKVVWIGRREEDEAIRAKAEALGTLGTTPLYVSADAADLASLQNAYTQIKQHYAHIDGLLHSAIVLADKSIANMQEERFRTVLASKVDVSVNMLQVFQQEPLDFILFFSSTTAFGKEAGQCNYAAGCAFKDMFARSLSQEMSCAVKVMNWGYWGTVGVAANEYYQKRMEAIGAASINPEEGMQALEMLMSCKTDHLVLNKTTDAERMDMDSNRGMNS